MHTLVDHASTTEAVHCDRADSLEEWRQVAANRITPVRVAAAEGFSGLIRWRTIEQTCLSEITADAHTVRRSRDLIDKDSRQYIKLSLQLEGTGTVSQGGRLATLQPGDLAIYETSYPYTLDFPEALRCMVMAFPLKSLDVPLASVRRVTAVCLPGDSGLGQMVSPFMRHLSENLDQLSGVTGARMLRSTFDLLTAFVYTHLPDEDDQRTGARRDELQALKLYMDEHLHDPELNADAIARAHFVSVRYLQYLFSQEDITVSGYIRARRLERCRLDLLDPGQSSLSVLHIAQRRGFTDASHFSKVFKLQFGVAPRDFRAAHLPV
ncbi:helix-turn-helix domain-containing protein [Nesterenkonia lutea]|nr:helix-turn-helix domain-containing protein [Nesterenkonia lutea]